MQAIVVRFDKSVSFIHKTIIIVHRGQYCVRAKVDSVWHFAVQHNHWQLALLEVREYAQAARAVDNVRVACSHVDGDDGNVSALQHIVQVFAFGLLSIYFAVT